MFLVLFEYCTIPTCRYILFFFLIHLKYRRCFLDQYCFSVHARRKLMRKYNNYNLMTMKLRPAEIECLLLTYAVKFSYELRCSLQQINITNRLDESLDSGCPWSRHIMAAKSIYLVALSQTAYSYLKWIDLFLGKKKLHCEILVFVL